MNSRLNQTNALTRQSAEQIDKTTRGQCSNIALFNVDIDDAKDLSRSFNDPALREAYNLPQGHYFLKSRFQPVQRLRLW